ncbi:serine hydrolase [Pedobacter sp. ASV28]|uniref:serine hydrolase domain-containing protein n=1 Tax=Pedobacter sp. ASV28 TaxID=2795123 RepID=UPI0018EBCD0B|nr:serine hydrolase domain-containing protein [Pedobacter sp. ASV28]
MKKILTFLVLFVFTVTTNAQIQQAENQINEMMGKLKVVGLAVAVVKNNKIIYTHSFGKKNIADQTPLSNDDIFRIASISKSFAATSIMQLAEAKKLSLEDDFSDLVGFKVRNPQFPETVITLKMVLSHTSSINDSQGYFNLDVINADKNSNWAKCYTNKQPGTTYLYCNLNFNMVGAVIEKISGKRYDNYVKQNILDPLGLYGGYCVDSLEAKRFVPLYEYDEKLNTYQLSEAVYAPRREELKTYQLGYSTPILSPTGGMKISAIDLAKYMMMHMNYGKLGKTTVMKKKSAKIMQTKISEEEGYGLAIRTINDLIPGKTMKGHTGSAYGLYSAMFFEPHDKFGIVVITNGSDASYIGGTRTILKESINILYHHLIK